MRYICAECHGELFEIGSDGVVVGDNGKYSVSVAGWTSLPLCQGCRETMADRQCDENALFVSDQLETIIGNAQTDFDDIREKLELVMNDHDHLFDDCPGFFEKMSGIKKKVSELEKILAYELENLDYHQD